MTNGSEILESHKNNFCALLISLDLNLRKLTLNFVNQFTYLVEANQIE